MSTYLSLYLSIYVCMRVCMYVCMHASCIYDDRLFGGAYEIAMGWEMAPGASRAQESQVRRKILGGWRREGQSIWVEL